MSIIVEAQFDGENFIPTGPIDLPVGTKVTLTVRELNNGTNGSVSIRPPLPMTDEDRRIWEEIRRDLEANPPEEATLEEAMRKIRGPSWS